MLLMQSRNPTSTFLTTFLFNFSCLVRMLDGYTHFICRSTSFGSTFSGSKWFHCGQSIHRIPHVLQFLSGQGSGHFAINIDHLGFPSRIFFIIYPLSDVAEFIFESSKNNQFPFQIHQLPLTPHSYFLSDSKSMAMSFKSYEDVLQIDINYTYSDSELKYAG